MWGVQGPGLAFRDEWQGDHAMRSLRHFWEAETRRRGMTVDSWSDTPFSPVADRETSPTSTRWPPSPRTLLIVATGDQVHHGIAYGTPADEALPMGDGGLAAARNSMERGIDFIASGDYWGYDRHCVEAKSDDRDAAQLYMHLRGPLEGTLLDIGASDATALYDAPAPSWAAGGLIEFRKA